MSATGASDRIRRILTSKVNGGDAYHLGMNAESEIAIAKRTLRIIDRNLDLALEAIRRDCPVAGKGGCKTVSRRTKQGDSDVEPNPQAPAGDTIGRKKRGKETGDRRGT